MTKLQSFQKESFRNFSPSKKNFCCFLMMCIEKKEEKKKFLNEISSQSTNFSAKPMMLVSTIKIFQWMDSLYSPS